VDMTKFVVSTNGITVCQMGREQSVQIYQAHVSVFHLFRGFSN